VNRRLSRATSARLLEVHLANESRLRCPRGPIHGTSPIFLMLGISIQIDAQVEEVQTVSRVGSCRYGATKI
jgi:hypothetical protein